MREVVAELEVVGLEVVLLEVFVEAFEVEVDFDVKVGAMVELDLLEVVREEVEVLDAIFVLLVELIVDDFELAELVKAVEIEVEA